MVTSKYFSKIFILTIIALVEARKQPKIVIIGAGLSGMSAATKLLENGFTDIVVLEAENRIGGRIYSTNFSTGIIDLGGQWVHGVKDNIVYEIVNGSYKFGVTGFDDKLPLFVRSNGTVADQKKCEDLSYLALKVLFSSYDEMSQFPGSIGDFFNKKFKSDPLYEMDQKLGDEIVDFYEKEMNIWNGSQTYYDLSAQLHCVSGFNEGLQYLTWNKDGFKEFFKYLTHQIPTSESEKPLNVLSKVILNQEVTNIEWNTPKLKKKFVIVTVNNKKKYYADHVIVTVSLGVLKDRHKTLFKPQLPRNMKRAINGLGFGNIGKIFLEFDKPFWPKNKDWVGYGFLWTKEDIATVKGTDREWLLDLQMFTKVDQFPNVIEALLAGYHMEMFENLSRNKIINDCIWLLEKFFKVVMPRPKDMIKTGWLTNRNFLGSYSYYSMKSSTFNVSTDDLAQTLRGLENKPEVLFAGEHTDSLFSSNAHGAVRSGFRAAFQLIGYYKDLN